MKDETKQKITGFAKTVGKFTLKGIERGAEFIGRGALQATNAIVTNPAVQHIATAAGLVAASIAMPTVGIGLAATVGLKYLYDKVMHKGQNRGLFDEIGDILGGANQITKAVGDKVLSPVINLGDKGLEMLGDKAQQGINDLFDR